MILRLGTSLVVRVRATGVMVCGLLVAAGGLSLVSVARAQDGTSVAPVPVEIVGTVDTLHGVMVTMVNRSPHAIVAYAMGATRLPEDEAGYMQSHAQTSGIAWRPGAEHRTTLSLNPGELPARIIVKAVMTADGAGFGDPAIVERFRSEWRRQRAGLTEVLRLLEGASEPASDDELQTLADQIALEMARVPGGQQSEQRMHPYLTAIAGLKRLQGRGLDGTERLSRELARVRADLRSQLESVPGKPQ